jgi:hypothetical protein
MWHVLVTHGVMNSNMYFLYKWQIIDLRYLFNQLKFSDLKIASSVVQIVRFNISTASAPAYKRNNSSMIMKITKMQSWAYTEKKLSRTILKGT